MKCRYCGAKYYPSHADRYDAPNCRRPECRRARKTELQRERRAERMRAGLRASGPKVRQPDRVASSPRVRQALEPRPLPELRRHQVEHLGS